MGKQLYGKQTLFFIKDGIRLIFLDFLTFNLTKKLMKQYGQLEQSTLSPHCLLF